MSTIGLAIDDLESMLDQTMSELDGWMLHMKQSGMSNQHIKALVTKDLAEGGRVFGQFKRGIKTQVSGAVIGSKVEMNMKTMMKKGLNKAKWVVRSPNPCPDCSPRHGRVETMAYWKQIGVPASGFSICRYYCHCEFVDENAKIPDHPIKDPIKKKSKVGIPKKDLDFRQRTDATLHWDKTIQSGNVGRSQARNITQYTSKRYKTINPYLGIERSLEQTAGRKALQHHADIIQKGLNDAPDYVGKTYRKQGFAEKDRWVEFIDQHRQGNIVKKKAFMSTSYDKKVIKDYGDELYQVEIEVESKTGSIIETISANPSDKEVLFKYDSMFEVTKLDIDDNLAIIKIKEL